MEDNNPKTKVDINDKDLENEINQLQIKVLPPPKIDNIKADLTFKLNHVYP